jgi:hypothetical protein
MKHLLLIFLSFFAIPAFSQETAPDETKNHTIGIFLSPGEFIFWGGVPTGSIFADRVAVLPASPSGLEYGYNVSNFFNLRAGITYSYERCHFSMLYDDRVKEQLDNRISYVRVPLCARIYTSNFLDADREGGFFLEFQGIMDFIMREDAVKKTVPYVIDHHYPAPPGGYGTVPVTTTETHSRRVRFNRICPQLFIGKEFIWEEMTFYFGVKIEFPSVLQEYNTQEIYKNAKISPMNMGLSYRF